jgi:hypothetical protein
VLEACAKAGEGRLMSITAAMRSGKIRHAARRMQGTRTIGIRINPPEI